MFKNYFPARHFVKTAWRNIIRNKSYSLINVSGLAVGIAAALLIFIVVSYELSYDTFQKNYNNIYRIVTNTRHSDGNTDRNPGIQCPAIDALNAGFPQFIKTVPVTEDGSPQFTVVGDNANNDVAAGKKFIEENKTAVFTQPSYFDIFNAVWLAGNKAVLNDPSSVVLNKTLAIKYFGDWKNAPGKFLKLDNTILLKVSGVVEDAPENSDFPIIAFLSYEAFKRYGGTYGYDPYWGYLSSSNQLYALLPPASNIATVNAQLNAFLRKQQGRDLQSDKSYVLQPLKDMHFDYRYETFGDHSSNKNILLTLAFIGVLIICMASINYINLATAQAISRSKEVGIRKVLGSTRSSLMMQVMSETFIVVFISTFFAVLIAKLSLPYLSNVAAVPADIALLNTQTIFFLLAVMLIVTVLSGFYPAIILSRYQPVLALKNKIALANIGGISLRRILVVTQFAVSQMLIIGTIVAVSQMNYVQHADLGFNKEAVLVLPAYSDSANLSRMQPLKQQLLQNPDVVSVSFASDEPSSDNNSSTNFAFDHKDDKDFPLFIKNGDEDYISTFGLRLIAGRGLTASDTLKEAVVNETLLKKLGINDPEKAIGKDIRIGSSRWLPVVGVIKDFKTNSLREEVKQLAIFSRKTNYSTIAVKLHTKNMAQTVSQLQKIWEKTYPEYAFTSHFTDETIAKFYSQETRLALLYKIFAGIAIFISCLGLYGLVSYMAAQKTKEVGIRKVLGAGIANIVILFSKEFVWLIIIAFAVAVPVAYYFMHNWLQSFAYRINIGAGVFALAIITSLVIALLTIGYRAVKAAMANPVKSLRTE
ncbi:ABC transporter permease [Parafilimonas sp.]|uniref:ABC transporter permease n=1 Tax=Parafilimonas sp. TaxID=1969739 RepID=UPI0039E63840